MKKIFFFLFFIFILKLSYSQWQQLGGMVDQHDIIASLDIEVDIFNNLYVAYSYENVGIEKGIRVKKYTNGQWQTIGNFNQTEYWSPIMNLEIHPYTYEPHIIFGDGNYPQTTYIKKFTSSNWQTITSLEDTYRANMVLDGYTIRLLYEDINSEWKLARYNGTLNINESFSVIWGWTSFVSNGSSLVFSGYNFVDNSNKNYIVKKYDMTTGSLSTIFTSESVGNYSESETPSIAINNSGDICWAYGTFNNSEKVCHLHNENGSNNWNWYLSGAETSSPVVNNYENQIYFTFIKNSVEIGFKIITDDNWETMPYVSHDGKTISTQTLNVGQYGVFIFYTIEENGKRQAYLKKYCPTPSITSHPQSQTVDEGSYVSFGVSASDATSYQWKKNGSNISGATSSTYQISSAQVSDAGTYVCVASNDCGEVTSNSAVLTVNATSNIANNGITDISIYPNPTNGKISVETDEEILIKIYSISGIEVYQQTINKDNNIVDLSNLANGVYFLNTNYKNSIINKQIIINH